MVCTMIDVQTKSITAEFGRKFDNWEVLQTSVALSGVWWGGIFFNTDGSKIFLTQYGNGGRIYESNLSNPYDISNIDFSKYISMSNPEDIHFSPDGTKMFILKSDTSPYAIWRYTLTTARDISTATHDQTLTRNVSSDRGMYFTPDGKDLYIGSSGGILYHATLSTAWDLTTAGSVSQISSTLGGFSIRFGKNGTILLNSVENSSVINYHFLAVPYDINSITQEGSLNVGTNRAGGMWFNDGGTMSAIVGGGGSTNYATKYKV